LNPRQVELGVNPGGKSMVSCGVHKSPQSLLVLHEHGIIPKDMSALSFYFTFAPTTRCATTSKGSYIWNALEEFEKESIPE
jgi:hypothetical protein